jgi:hypothetical protein
LSEDDPQEQPAPADPGKPQTSEDEPRDPAKVETKDAKPSKPRPDRVEQTFDDRGTGDH